MTQKWTFDHENCTGSLTTSLNYSKPGANFKELGEHNQPPDPATKGLKVKVQRMIDDGCFSEAPYWYMISMAMNNFRDTTNKYGELIEAAIISTPKKTSMVYRVQCGKKSWKNGFT